MRRKKSAVMQLHAAVGQRPAYAEEVGPSHRHVHAPATAATMLGDRPALHSHPGGPQGTFAFCACVLQARKAGVVDALTRLLGSTGESPLTRLFGSTGESGRAGGGMRMKLHSSEVPRPGDWAGRAPFTPFPPLCSDVPCLGESRR